MTWDELLLLLQSYKKEDADLSGIVRLVGNDMLEPLVLAEKSTTGELIMVVNWDTGGDDGEDGA